MVWSRIDADEMKAVPLTFTKRKLQEIARERHLEHDWTMPRGFAGSQERDPRNFTLQQAKRAGKDPRGQGRVSGRLRDRPVSTGVVWSRSIFKGGIAKPGPGPPRR